jgi:hypothetical protein
MGLCFEDYNTVEPLQRSGVTRFKTRTSLLAERLTSEIDQKEYMRAV